MTGARDVDAAVDAMVSALRPLCAQDWSVPAGTQAWTCRETAVHVADDLLSYAGQVAGLATEAYLPFALTVPDDTAPPEVLDVVAACGALLAAALAAAPEGTVAWHWGMTDGSGFAALGVTEVLDHTYDIALGLGERWTPPHGLSVGALARLFPDAPAGEPAAVLL